MPKNEEICTECQLMFGDPEAHCYKQNGRPCYLDKQREFEAEDSEDTSDD